VEDSAAQGTAEKEERDEMRIFHVSDLHLRRDPRHNVIVADKLAKLFPSFGEGDVLVVTGDITDDGREEQYAHALTLLAPFAGRIVITPGNHDFGALGMIYSKDCHKRFTKLRHALCADKPYLFRVDGEAVGEIIVLDSCMRTGSLVDFAQGQIGRWNLWKLKRKLDAMKKAGAVSVVALHHNPFYQDWFCRLNDAKKFLETVMGRADVVLCGHEHKYRHTWFPSGLPEDQAQTLFWAADALKYERTEVLSIPIEMED
jgi:3',5'-cyclic AMP phosphodiesterase CpdA